MQNVLESCSRWFQIDLRSCSPMEKGGDDEGSTFEFDQYF